MKNTSKKTIKINEEFNCEYCRQFNRKADKTCRNHCFDCLYSKHVDDNFPGDRKSKCQGLMQPLAIDYKNKKGLQIVHECLLCLKRMLNKTLPDDNIETITKIMKKQNLHFQ